ncbi:MAG: hypothetical protein AB7S38_03205 [Vulcanimicrobiota bacterium]
MLFNQIYLVFTEYLKEFVPAQKTEILLLALSIFIMSCCLWEQAVTSGLSGELTYATLHPGVTFSGIGTSLLLVALTVVFPAQSE